MPNRRIRGLGPLPRHGVVRSAVAESATTLERTARRAERVTGQALLAETPAGGKSGRLTIRLIRAGWSLNGSYYPAETLKRDGARAWPAGTQAFIDHAPDAADEDYPSGSIKNLAAVLTTDAIWNESTQSLEAEARLFAPWRDAIIDMAEAIGMSIRAWVYGEHGEAEGRQGFVVTSIAEGRSVDFVTVPAAGGAILSVLESVQLRRTVEARNIGAWIESRLHLSLTQIGDDLYGDGRLTRDERITLSAAIGDGLQAWTTRVEAEAPQLFQRDLWTYPEPAADDVEEARRAAEASTEETRAALQRVIQAAHGNGDTTWAWVRDFDPATSTVWFDVSVDGECATWQQAYTGDGSEAALAGERVEVIARTVYAPVTAAGDSAEESAVPATAATAVTETVTDGTPPTVTDPPTEEEPTMSDTQTGAPPETAGTAPVVDTPPIEAPAVAEESATAAALRAVTEQLTAMQQQLTAVTASSERRDADNRRQRNEATAREAITAALNAPDVQARWRAHIAPRVTAEVLARIPVTATGDVDGTALAASIAASIAAESTHAQTLVAQALEDAGIGMPSGLGASEVVVDDGLDKALAELFEGSLGLTANASKIAVKGRG